MATYATLAELAEHLTPDAPPANGARLLVRASRRVDGALLCAVYDVDATTGLPTKQTIVEALRDATLEQISYWLETGDDEGLAGSVVSAKIGSASVQRGGAGASSESGQLCGAALDVLATAGLTGQGPRSC